MKFGICSEIFKEWNSIARTMAYIKEVGYDGLEIAPFMLGCSVRDISNAVRKEIVGASQAAGVEIIGLHWVLMGVEGAYLTHPDAGVRDYTARYLMDLAGFCGEIGGKVMVFGSPKQRNLMRGVSYQQAFDYAREVFEKALPMCEASGVTICMEQLNANETDFCSTPEETVRLIEAIHHPHFQLLLDVKAMSDLPADRPEVIRDCAGCLKHFHANDANLNGPGWGEVDFVPIFRTLRDIAYRGYVSVEVFNFDPGPEAIATRSLAYMKQCLDLIG